MLDPCKSQQPLFTNRRGTKLSRFGVRYILDKYVNQVPTLRAESPITPHTLRHTKAMHLLEANTPLVVIRDFLGHVDINTTGIYARASMKMKREALENAEETSPKTSISTAPWKRDKNLMDWLQSL